VRSCEVLLILVAGLILFSRLDCPLQEPEESLYAEIPRQMLAEGRLLVPVRHGQDYYDKPPLLYWLVMGMYELCGVHDWAARLVPSSAAFLCVLVVYGWGKRSVSPRAAFAGALMLCLSPRFAQMARMLTTNGLLTLWVVAAFAAAHRALAEPAFRRGWWFLSALACGLGVLTKGPVALVLVAAPVLLYQRLDRRGAAAGLRHWLVYLAVVSAIALPWFVIVTVRDLAFLDYFVWTHHIRRFLDPIDHLQPVWYYGPILFIGMMPWTLLLPGFVRYLARPMTVTEGAVPQRSGALGFFLLAGIWCLMFFSASGCKRPSYILPAMPFLALALGCYVDAACSWGWLRQSRWAGVAAATFALLLAAAVCLLPGYAAKYSMRAQVAPHFEACASAAPVMCYPHGWDGVSFYLQHNNVRVFRPRQLNDMISALGRESQSLVVVKSDDSLKRFLTALPQSLEFVCSSCAPTVTVGWVQRRQNVAVRKHNGGLRRLGVIEATKIGISLTMTLANHGDYGTSAALPCGAGAAAYRRQPGSHRTRNAEHGPLGLGAGSAAGRSCRSPGAAAIDAR
jgi:4-amino-4-deoxy-L-arabinose transferase-like glycosyltransferase